MRRLVAALLVLAAGLAAAPAHAAGVCDPHGHFCIQIDTTGARVCDLLRPGALDPAACGPQAKALRKQVASTVPPPLGASLLSFDGWDAQVFVLRHAAQPELSDADVEAYGRRRRETLEQRTGRPFDAFAKPTLGRSGGVQTVRLDRRWTQGGTQQEEIDIEVRARDAMYVVAFDGAAGPHLSALADGTLATLDALPPDAGRGALDVVGWLVRAVLVAAALAGVGIWADRRRRSRTALASRGSSPAQPTRGGG